MAFARPALTEIIDRVLADISSRVTGVDGAVLRRSLLGIVGTAEAGAVHLLYGYLDWIALQVIPDTAEAEYLERWAAIWGVFRKPATFAAGTLTFTGSPGSSMAASTLTQRQDGGQYATLSAAVFTAGTLDVAVQALVAGVAGNVAAGVAVQLLSPVAGVQSRALVAASGLTGGADVESDASLLARLLARIQQPPQGGAQSDYERWALEVAEVTRVWVAPLEMGAGTVTVRFVTDDAAGGLIPTEAKVAELQAYINARRPVTATVYAVAALADPLALSIKLSPNTSAVQAAVTAELQDLLRRDSAPGKVTLISRLREAVSLAAGEADNQITSPTADVAHTVGRMATLGVITFSAL